MLDFKDIYLLLYRKLHLMTSCYKASELVCRFKQTHFISFCSLRHRISAFVSEIQLKINSVCVREKCLSCEGWWEWHSPVRHPGNASPAAPGRKHAGTPSGWGFPARFPRSARTASGVDEPPAAYAPSTATTNTESDSAALSHRSHDQKSHSSQYLLMYCRASEHWYSPCLCSAGRALCQNKV